MKFIPLFLATFCTISLFARQGKEFTGELKEYNRSALAVMMIYHPEDEFAFNIAEVFNTIPCPDKYDEHNVGLQIIDNNEFCFVKHKNETYAYRSKDENIYKKNMDFYESMNQRSAFVTSWHYNELYRQKLIKIIRQQGITSFDPTQLSTSQILEKIKTLDSEKSDKISKKIEEFPIGLHKAKYGKILSASMIKENAKAIETVLNENEYAKMMIARWFNMTGNDENDFVFNMETVKKRGNYNATESDVKMARNTVRGVASISDMGEELINNSFILVNDITYVTAEEKAEVAKIATKVSLEILGAFIGKNMDNTIQIVHDFADSFTGFNVKTHSYLYQLKWNDSIAAIFYDNYYIETPDSARLAAFFADSTTFRMQYVAHEYEFDEKSTFKGSYDRNELIRMGCTRSMDKNIAALQKKYEDFKVKTPIKSIEVNAKGKVVGYNAEIGLKEGITKKSKFQVIQKIVDEKRNRVSYRYIATLKPVKGKIWDNRYNAVKEHSQGSQLHYTTLKKVSGGEILPGMLIIEGKYSKVEN